ncbi:MAG: T9SS type A sorting domain-containing protein [Saprospiraceae bacterium]|nr:T9SS type A sorting domain-containing protein [Saprospiraceae bacterium]
MTIKNFTLVGFIATCCITSLSAQSFDIYISDAGNFNLPPWQILKFDQNGENGQVFISEHLSWPQDIFFVESENTVLVTNLNTGTISKFHATTGEFIEEFATNIGGPTRMELGPDSLLYVLQWVGNGKVRRYKLDGSFMDEFTATGVGTSIGLDWDAVGNLYVSSYNGKYVRKFSPTGADLGNFISTNLAGPTNIWFADNGDLMVVDYNGSAVKRFDSNGNFMGVFITGLPQGEGVDFMPNGDIVIGSGGTSSVRVYDASGAFVNDLVPAGTLGLLTPNAVVFRPTAPSDAPEVAQDFNFVTPSIGNQFRVSNPQVFGAALTCEVFDTSGMFVGKINFADNATWDASNLGNGVYFIAAKLADGRMVRQKVVVQQ